MRLMPASRSACVRPRFAMTVDTAVSPASRPRSFRSMAHTASTMSPSISLPSESMSMTRSASPSCAMPTSASHSATRARRGSRCVEPHWTLMSVPQ